MDVSHDFECDNADEEARITRILPQARVAFLIGWSQDLFGMLKKTLTICQKLYGQLPASWIKFNRKPEVLEMSVAQVQKKGFTPPRDPNVERIELI